MQFATVPELTSPPPPEAVSKTDKSVTLRTKLDAQPLDRKLAFQVVRAAALLNVLRYAATSGSIDGGVLCFVWG